MTFIMSKDLIHFGTELCVLVKESAFTIVNPELKFISVMLAVLVLVGIHLARSNRVRQIEYDIFMLFIFVKMLPSMRPCQCSVVYQSFDCFPNQTEWRVLVISLI